MRQEENNEFQSPPTDSGGQRDCVAATTLTQNCNSKTSRPPLKTPRSENSPMKNIPTVFQRNALWTAITALSLTVIGSLAIGFVYLGTQVMGYLQPILVLGVVGCSRWASTLVGGRLFQVLHGLPDEALKFSPCSWGRPVLSQCYLRCP